MAINKGMVLIKVVYSTAYLGIVILLPYLTLQALSLGLTYEDISIIYGITPAITFMMSPLSGIDYAERTYSENKKYHYLSHL